VLKVRAGGYSIELANPRHEHEWRLWEHLTLPKDTVLIPGVISHATNIVEHPELVAERIVRLARLVGRENVIASTDCGFAQVTYFTRVHRSCGQNSRRWPKARGSRAWSSGAAA
jgi:5-methyltetrahydropteroyltriglutamate--homocysteine methyltransferase